MLIRKDSGLGVRKRVIKLLTGIFSTVADTSIQTDICCRMIEAMNDSDDGVKVSQDLSFSWTVLMTKALATKSLAELLYPPSGLGHNTSLLTDIVSEYHGDQKSLEAAVQKVS
jgi:cohesin loading factor subunit SCC2